MCISMLCYLHFLDSCKNYHLLLFRCVYFTLLFFIQRLQYDSDHYASSTAWNPPLKTEPQVPSPPPHHRIAPSLSDPSLSLPHHYPAACPGSAPFRHYPVYLGNPVNMRRRLEKSGLNWIARMSRTITQSVNIPKQAYPPTRLSPFN